MWDVKVLPAPVCWKATACCPPFICLAWHIMKGTEEQAQSHAPNPGSLEIRKVSVTPSNQKRNSSRKPRCRTWKSFGQRGCESVNQPQKHPPYASPAPSEIRHYTLLYGPTSLSLDTKSRCRANVRCVARLTVKAAVPRPHRCQRAACLPRLFHVFGWSLRPCHPSTKRGAEAVHFKKQ